MRQEDRINDFYSKLNQDEFIRTHSFEKYRFGNQEFYAFAATLKSKSGREITCSFNIHDEEPDEVELVMQFLNKSSLEQIRTIAEQIASDLVKDINIYNEPNCVSMVSYFDIEDVEGVLNMLKVTLKQVNKVMFFLLNPED